MPTYHLAGFRLRSVGEDSARIPDLHLNFTAPTPGTGTGPADSLLWLRNGGGKSSILALLYAMLLPRAVDFMGRVAKRSITDYVATGDTSHTVATWHAVGGPRTLTGAPEQVLITGVVYEWADLRRPAHADSARDRLNIDFYAVPGVLDAARLPVEDADGRPRRRTAFLAELRKIAAAHPQATDLVVTDKMHVWADQLTRRGLDPDVFRSQKQMNHVEGGVENLFRFASAREFIDFFLTLTVEPEASTNVAARLSEIATLLAQKPAKIAERDFAVAAGAGLRAVHEAATDAQEATTGKAATSTAAADLAAAFTATIAAARTATTVLVKQIEDTNATISRTKTETNLANDLAFLYRERAAMLRLAAAEQAHLDAVEASRIAGETATAWRHTPPLAERAELIDALVRVRVDLAKEDADAAPLRADHDLHAARYKAHLLTLAATASESATQLRGVAEQRDKDGQAHDRNAAEARTVLTEATGQAATATAHLDALDADLRRAVTDGILPTEDTSPAAQHETTTGLVAARTARLEEIRARRADRPAQRDALTTRLTDAAGEHARLDGEHSRAAAEHADLTTRAASLAAAPRLQELTEATVGEPIDVWAEHETLTRPLTDAIYRTDMDLVRHEAARLDDQRLLDTHARTGLLPSSVDADRVTGVLTDGDVPAEPGWTHLRALLSADRLRAALDDPDLARLGCGVVIPEGRADDATRLLAALDTRTTALVGVYTAAQAAALTAAHTATPDGTAPDDTDDVPAWTGLQPGMIDEDTAASTADALDRAKAAHEEHRQHLIGQRDEDRALLHTLDGLLTVCPPGYLATLHARITDLDERLRGLDETRARLATDLATLKADDTADAATEKDLTGQISVLNQHLTRLTLLIRATEQAATWRLAADEATNRAEAAARRAKEQAALARTAFNESHRHVADAEKAATDADRRRTQHAQINYLDAEPATVPADPTATPALLRSRWEAALHAYQVQVSASVLAEREHSITERLKTVEGIVAVIPAAERVTADALLATPAGATADARQDAIRVATAAHTQALTDLGRADGAVTAAKVSLTEASGRRVDRPRRTLPTDPATAEHADTLGDEQVAAGRRSQELRSEAETRLRDQETRRGQFTSRIDTFTALLLGLPDPATPRIEPYPHDAEQARADVRTATTALDEATQRLLTAERHLAEVVTALRAIANRYPGVTTPAKDRVLHDSERALAANAEHLATQLRLRAEMIEGELATIALDQDIVASSLAHLVQKTLDTIRKAERYSRLPDSLGSWGGKHMLKIAFEEPATEADLLLHINRVIDARIAAGVKPEGLPLLKEAVHEVVGPRGFTVRVLKPTRDITAPREDISRLAKWSGGEKLTVCVALYCTIAELRAANAGRRDRSGGVLLLDNPIGTASHGPLVALQRDVAAARGVQLIYTTGVKDPDAVSQFPNVIVLENRPGRTRNRGYVIEVDPDEPTDGEPESAGYLGGVRVGHRDHRRRGTHQTPTP